MFLSPNLGGPRSACVSFSQTNNANYNNGARGSSSPESVNSARMKKAKEAQRLTRLYGTSIKSVAPSQIRFKPKRVKAPPPPPSREKNYNQHSSLFNSQSSESSHIIHVASAALKFMKPLKQRKKQKIVKPPTPFERLSQPKTTVSKFQDRSQEERKSTEMHADNDQNISQPWFVGYRNSPALPAGSPLCIASRYGYQGTVRLIRQSTERYDFRFEIKKNTASPQLNLPSSEQLSDEFLSHSGEDKLSSYQWHDRKPYSNVNGKEKLQMKNSLSSHLLRAVDRERKIWEEVSEKAARERVARRSETNNTITRRHPNYNNCVTSKSQTKKVVFVLR